MNEEIRGAPTRGAGGIFSKAIGSSLSFGLVGPIGVAALRSGRDRMVALGALVLVVMTLVPLVVIVITVSVRWSILVHLRRARAKLLRSRIAITAHVDLILPVSGVSIAIEILVILTLALLLG